MVKTNFFNIIFNIPKSTYVSWIKSKKLLWGEVEQRVRMDYLFNFIDYSELKSIRDNDDLGSGVLEVSLKFALKFRVGATAEQQDEFYKFIKAHFDLPVLDREGSEEEHNICRCIYTMEYVEPIEWSSTVPQQKSNWGSLNWFYPKKQ